MLIEQTIVADTVVLRMRPASRDASSSVAHTHQVKRRPSMDLLTENRRVATYPAFSETTLDQEVWRRVHLRQCVMWNLGKGYTRGPWSVGLRYRHVLHAGEVDFKHEPTLRSLFLPF